MFQLSPGYFLSGYRTTTRKTACPRLMLDKPVWPTGEHRREPAGAETKQNQPPLSTCQCMTQTVRLHIIEV